MLLAGLHRSRVWKLCSQFDTCMLTNGRLQDLTSSAIDSFAKTICDAESSSVGLMES